MAELKQRLFNSWTNSRESSKVFSSKAQNTIESFVTAALHILRTANRPTCCKSNLRLRKKSSSFLDVCEQRNCFSTLCFYNTGGKWLQFQILIPEFTAHHPATNHHHTTTSFTFLPIFSAHHNTHFQCVSPYNVSFISNIPIVDYIYKMLLWRSFLLCNINYTIFFIFSAGCIRDSEHLISSAAVWVLHAFEMGLGMKEDALMEKVHDWLYPFILRKQKKTQLCCTRNRMHGKCNGTHHYLPSPFSSSSPVFWQASSFYKWETSIEAERYFFHLEYPIQTEIYGI